eukprot:Anaeramoba_ignava/a354808_135.p1 GENE.a354808_135~~a354808_135.p1  ORF type:complete len:136 (-),score=46.65 a354808_135:16-423(-)
MFGLFKRSKKKKEAEAKDQKLTTEDVLEENLEEKEDEKVIDKETVVEEQIVENNAEEVTNEEKELEKPKKERKQPYHITTHPDGGWQIKRGKAKKALRRFDTQNQAIEFAKALEKEKGESYIIHKADGTTRKKTY